jgi:UDP-GlcNAc3NAcA epimerase
MNKAALVVGARPQFIKTAPLISELGRFWQMVLIHTGQHFDFMMSENFFRELSIPKPDYHLNIPQGTQGKQTGRMIEGLESVLKFENPELVIVVGDTNSTMAGAIAATKLRLPLTHVEAGVRANDKNLPEQINRVVTDSISDCFFCPSETEIRNLAAEGISENVFDSGDVIYDCLRMFEKFIPQIPQSLSDLPSEFVLATLHRAEAVDNRENLENILRSLSIMPFMVLFPIHPRTLKRLHEFNLFGSLPENIRLINPVGYLDILSLIRRAKLVVTDSGGIQREAVYLNKPVLIARPETEWLGLQKTGLLKIVGYSFSNLDFSEIITGNNAIIEHITRPASKMIAETLNSQFAG